MEYSKGGSNLSKVSEIGRKAILGTILPVIIKTLLRKKNIKGDVLDDNKLSIIENVLRVKMLGPDKQESETVKKDTSIKNKDFHFSTIREPRANAMGLSEFFTLHLKNLQEKNPDDKFINRLLPEEIFQFEDTIIEGEVDEVKRQELENKKKVRNEILDARKDYEEKIKKQQEEFDKKMQEEFENQQEKLQQTDSNIENQKTMNFEELKKEAIKLKEKKEEIKEAEKEKKSEDEIKYLKESAEKQQKIIDDLKQKEKSEQRENDKKRLEEFDKLAVIAIESVYQPSSPEYEEAMGKLEALKLSAGGVPDYDETKLKDIFKKKLETQLEEENSNELDIIQKKLDEDEKILKEKEVILKELKEKYENTEHETDGHDAIMSEADNKFTALNLPEIDETNNSLVGGGNNCEECQEKLKLLKKTEEMQALLKENNSEQNE